MHGWTVSFLWIRLNYIYLGEIFARLLTEWDEELDHQILLYIDGFSGHEKGLKKIVLNNISIKFLPPGTTAASQPMDAGIIENLKVGYRRLLLRSRIDHIDSGDLGWRPSLLDAVDYLKQAWDFVKQETIANCFKHAGFIFDEVS